MNAPAPLVDFADVAVGYGSKAVLSGLRFAIEPGEVFALVGPNGSGKTTILKTILGILPPLHGRVSCAFELRGGAIGYVPQRDAIDAIFPLTVLDVAVTGLYGRLGLFRRPGIDDRKKAAAALDRLGIADLMHTSYRDLSGGQRQRTLIARAIASDPTLLVLDEPTNGMDLGGSAAILDTVLSLTHRLHLTTIIVTHDLAVAGNIADRVGILIDGRFEVGSASEILTSERLTSLYGRAIRVLSDDGRFLISTPTELPRGRAGSGSREPAVATGASASRGAQA